MGKEDEKEYHIRIPYRWLDENLATIPKGGAEILLYIIRRMDWKTQEVNQHILTFAKGVGRHPANVRRMLYKLSARGFITIHLIGGRARFWLIEFLPDFRCASAPDTMQTARAGAPNQAPIECAGAPNTPPLSAPAHRYIINNSDLDIINQKEPAAPGQQLPPTSGQKEPAALAKVAGQPVSGADSGRSLQELVKVGFSQALAVVYASQLTYKQIHTVVDDCLRRKNVTRSKVGYIRTSLDNLIPKPSHPVEAVNAANRQQLETWKQQQALQALKPKETTGNTSASERIAQRQRATPSRPLPAVGPAPVRRSLKDVVESFKAAGGAS